MTAGVLESPRIDSAAVVRAKRLRAAVWAALPVMAAMYFLLLRAPIPSFSRLVLLELVYVEKAATV